MSLGRDAPAHALAMQMPAADVGHRQTLHKCGKLAVALGPQTKCQWLGMIK